METTQLVFKTDDKKPVKSRIDAYSLLQPRYYGLIIHKVKDSRQPL